MTKLALFDLDGTLISTQGVGMRAMAAAGAGLWGEKFHFEGVVSAGGLDPLLFRVAAERCGVKCSSQNEDLFRNAYCKALTEQLAGTLKDGSIRVLPGVHDMLQQVHAHPQVTLGLLTGNYRLTGPVKLRAAAIDPAMFVVTAFGDEAPVREDLVPVAIKRFTAMHGRQPHPRDVVVIGDTPRDVQAAAAHGCLSLAVATGPYTVKQLKEAGATIAVADLADASPLWELLEVEPDSTAPLSAIDGVERRGDVA